MVIHFKNIFTYILYHKIGITQGEIVNLPASGGFFALPRREVAFYQPLFFSPKAHTPKKFRQTENLSECLKIALIFYYVKLILLFFAVQCDSDLIFTPNHGYVFFPEPLSVVTDSVFNFGYFFSVFILENHLDLRIPEEKFITF